MISALWSDENVKTLRCIVATGRHSQRGIAQMLGMSLGAVQRKMREMNWNAGGVDSVIDSCRTAPWIPRTRHVEDSCNHPTKQPGRRLCAACIRAGIKKQSHAAKV